METRVVCKADVIKHMLLAPILKGLLEKWMYALLEFDVRFQLAKAVKGQALADLIKREQRHQPSLSASDPGFCFSTDQPASWLAVLDYTSSLQEGWFISLHSG